MTLKKSSYILPLIICVSLAGASDTPSTAKKRTLVPKPAAPTVEIPPPAPAEHQAAARIVHYGEKDIVQLKTKLLNTTIIILPRNEKILDWVIGDREYWVINGSENFAYVKPAKPATATNLNLVTASGNIYSFVLTEVSEMPDALPDLKVFVEAKEQSLVGAANQSPRFVSAHDVEDLQRRLEEAREELRRQKRITDEAVENAVNKFLGRLRFTYRYSTARKPFAIEAIFHDNKFTYIAIAHPSEAPTIYEIRDGQPNLIAFRFENGLYVVQKILDKGYLAVGKHKLEFTSEE